MNRGPETPRPVGLLEESNELVRCQPSLSDDGTQSTAVELLVVRDYDLGKRIRPPQNDVTSFLSPGHETRPFQRANALAPRQLRQLAHTATSSASSLSGGTGSLSSSSAAM